MRADDDGIDALLRTALWDTSGDHVEGGLVDRWESHASGAIAALDAIFTRRGFDADDAARVERALSEVGVPHEAAAQLLLGLRRFVRPLALGLAHAEAPSLRALGVRALAEISDETAPWLERLRDVDPTVRAMAVRALAARRRDVKDADALLRAALGDDDETVRCTAVATIPFFRSPSGGEALAERYEREPRTRVGSAIVRRVAEETRRAGVHCPPDTMNEAVGPHVRRVLVDGLGHDDPAVRKEASRALERLRGPDLAHAILDRLAVETDEEVRATLLHVPVGDAGERAWGVLSALLAGDANASVRTNAAWQFGPLGARGVPLLVAALDDPADGTRRAAAMMLGRVGDASALPALRGALARPENASARRELERAIADVEIRTRAT